MAKNHKVTDFEKFPVRISKNEAGSDAIVSSWAFVYFLLVMSSFSSLFRCVAFQSFSFFLFQLSQQARPQQGACLLLGVLFYFPNLSLFVSSYVKMKKFCSFQFNRLAISWPPWVRVWGWASCRFLPFTFFSWLAFCISPFISPFTSFIYDVRMRGVVSMFNETPHSFFVRGSS